jgi:hypothetical protein
MSTMGHCQKQYDYHNFNGKKGLYAFMLNKNLDELHINFFLTFVRESRVPATVLLLQQYNFIKDNFESPLASYGINTFFEIEFMSTFYYILNML